MTLVCGSKRTVNRNQLYSIIIIKKTSCQNIFNINTLSISQYDDFRQVVKFVKRKGKQVHLLPYHVSAQLPRHTHVGNPGITSGSLAPWRVHQMAVQTAHDSKTIRRRRVVASLLWRFYRYVPE